jgi:parallel beta-helix repeat protein
METRISVKTLPAIAAILLGFGCTIAAGGVIYVDADASTGGDGTSWGTAYKYLQDALYKPPSGGDQIWVAEGIYKPDEGGGKTPGDRTATFQLVNGVAIYGGYAGAGEPDPNQRDVELYETILSGDLLGNDGPDFANNAENSYHVVTGSGTDTTPVMDGFTITGGNANGSYNFFGGGMYNYYSSPAVTNCTFSGNSADGGGGMCNESSYPMLTNCTFSGNSADGGGGMCNFNSSPTVTDCNFSGNSADFSGGGLCNYWSDPTVTNCTFSGNSAEWDGGGMDNYESYPMVTNCIFTGNSAYYSGGGMDNYGSDPTVTNCTFTENSANWAGGGMSNSNSDPNVTNCTFIGNSAYYSGGGMDNFDNSNPTLTDCTFTGNRTTNNRGGGINNNNSSPTVTNCTFTDNRAGFNGGGMCGGNPIVTNCTFIGNSSVRDGGGMGESGGPITNCTFRGNWGGDDGGAMKHCSGPIIGCVITGNWSSDCGGGLYKCSSSLTNCIISGNNTNSGGGIYNHFEECCSSFTNCIISGNNANTGGGMYNYYSYPTVANCIFWVNSDSGGMDESAQIHGGPPAVDYSCIQGWTGALGGTGNIDDDPLFVGPGVGDLRLLPTSPCIDAGCNPAVTADTPDLDGDGNTTEPIPWDLNGNPRFVDQADVPDTGYGTAPIVDMGAYEANYIEVAMKFTPQASNPGSEGNWVKAHFVLPEGFLPEDVNTNTPAVIALLGIESDHMNVFINEDDLVEIEVAD